MSGCSPPSISILPIPLAAGNPHPVDVYPGGQATRAITVLVVDDQPSYREAVRSLLDAEPGIRVVGEAGDGCAGIDAARELRPDVVVMDVAMARLNGIEASRRIVAQLPGTRALCFSVHAEQQLVSTMLSAGASGYALKGSAADELVSAVIAVASKQTYLSPAVAEVVVRDYVSRLSSGVTSGTQLTSREREVLQLIAEGHGAELTGRSTCLASQHSSPRRSAFR